MILDRLENLANYVSLHPLFVETVDYLQHCDISHLEVGKKELKGRDLNINIAQTDPKTKEEARQEAHRQYIDIQIPLTGTEVMGYSPLESCKKTLIPYNEEKDIIFFEGFAQNYVAVKPGMFAIFFPQDVHAPGITPTGVKKLIIKVKA